MKPPALTLRQVAARLNVNYSTVWHLVMNRNLRAYKPAGQWRVDESDLEAYVESRKTPAPADIKAAVAAVFDPDAPFDQVGSPFV